MTSLERAWTGVEGAAPRRSGATYWMDAALIAAAGIDTVVFGPGGGGAHAAEEWADLATLDGHAAIMLAAARSFCGSAAR